MKAMGADMGMADDAEADAILCRELGLDPAKHKAQQSEEDKLLAAIMAGGDDEEMDDDALLAALDAEENEQMGQAKLEEAEHLWEQAEKDKVQCQTFNKAGNKADAVRFMKKYKEGLAKYNAILEEYPEVKQALAPAAAAAAAPAKPVAKPEEKKQAPANAASLSITQIYEKFHDSEETNSMAVIEKEVTRCTEVKNSSTDEEVQDLMEERIEQLKMNQEST